MARLIDNSDYLLNTSGPTISGTVFNCTLATWTYPSSTSNSFLQGMFIVGADNGNGRGFLLCQFGNTFKSRYTASNGSNFENTSTTTITANTWYHSAATFTVDNSLGSGTFNLFTNGTDKQTNSQGAGNIATNGNPVVGWSAGIQFFPPSSFFNGWVGGRLAEMGAWNAILTDAEIAALANGALPYTIRPKSLVLYAPVYGLVSPEVDLGGGAWDGTITGSPPPEAGPPAMLFTPRWPQGLDSTSGPAAFTNPVITSQVYRPRRITVVAY